MSENIVSVRPIITSLNITDETTKIVSSIAPQTTLTVISSIAPRTVVNVVLDMADYISMETV